MRRSFLVTLAGGVVVAAALGFLLGGLAVAAEPPVDWLTGPKFNRQMNLFASVTWSGVPLRDGLQKLARDNGVAILIDRRVDPGRKIELSLGGPLRDVLKGVAAAYNKPPEQNKARLRTPEQNKAPKVGITFPLGGGVIYFGPVAVTRSLRTLAEVRKEDMRKLPARTRLRLARVRRTSWDDLATPRELLQQTADTAGVDIKGLEQIPHDLWAGADLPPLSLADQVTLIAVQYDLTFRMRADGASITLDKVRGDDLILVKSYPGGSTARKTMQRYRERAPGAAIELAGANIVIRGSLEDHEQARGGRTATNTPTVGGTQVFTLTVDDKAIRPILNTLVAELKKTGVTLKVDETAIAAAGISLDRRVSFAVVKAPLDEFLTAALAPAGLTHRREGNVIHIVPAKPK